MVVIAQNVGVVVCWLVFCITMVDVKNFASSPRWLHGHPNSRVAHADDRLNGSKIIIFLFSKLFLAPNIAGFPKVFGPHSFIMIIATAFNLLLQYYAKERFLFG